MSGFKKGNKEWMKRRPISESDKRAIREGMLRYWFRKKGKTQFLKESQNDEG